VTGARGERMQLPDAAGIMRPVRRTLLMTPGDRPDYVDRARAAAADVVWLDLEDGVDASRKADARRIVGSALAADWACRELLVRVNAVAEGGLDDISAVLARGRPDGIVLSKVESADEVVAAAEAVRSAGAGSLPLWLMIETPRAVLDVDGIAAASGLVTALVFGAGALIRELGMTRGDDGGYPDGLHYAESRTVLTARARGLSAITGSYPRTNDPEGMRAHALRSFAIGFDGVLLVSPVQIGAAHAAWAPSPEEIADAGRLLAGLAGLRGADRSVGTVDGRAMIVDAQAASAELVLARGRIADRDAATP